MKFESGFLEAAIVQLQRFSLIETLRLARPFNGRRHQLQTATGFEYEARGGERSCFSGRAADDATSGVARSRGHRACRLVI